MFLQFLINGIVNGSIYAIVALGFAIIYNTTRIFHIAYSILFMIAPYMLFTFFNQIGLHIGFAVIIALIFTIFVCLGIEVLVYRPLGNKGASHNVILISSVGIMIVVINIIALLYGNETKIINTEIAESIEISNLIITYPQLIQFTVSIILILLFLLFLKFSKFGIKTRALRDDEYLCKIFSIDINKFRVKLFILSAFFAATGGILIAWDVGFDPYIGMPMLLNAVVALIIGGIGKFHAPIIGGFLIGILQSLVVWQFSANWQEAVTFGLLIIFLLFRSQGLFGEKRRLV